MWNRSRFKALVCSALAVLGLGAMAQAQVVISAVYGGGGATTGTTAIYQYDYIELFNRGTAAVSLNGLSLQYASSAASGTSGNLNAVYSLENVSIPAGRYYLVRSGSVGTVGGTPTTTHDNTTTSSLNLAAGSGKVALVNGTTALGCGGGTPCTATQLAQIIDAVGYGAALGNIAEGTPANNSVALDASQAVFRNSNGCTDTNNNNADFALRTGTAQVVFRNSASPANSCTVAATGACCTGTTCTGGVTQAACTTSGGTSWTANVTCTPNICAGACCALGNCSLVTDAANCLGFFQGAGTTCSASNICVAEPIVISQIYGGGGNTNAQYKQDFVEIYNRGTQAYTLTGWSLQYASATGSSWTVVNIPTITLQAGQYYTLRLAGSTTPDPASVDLTTFDLDVTTPSLNLSATGGKLALVRNQISLTGSACPSTTGNPLFADFVGYGNITGTGSCFLGNGPTGTNGANTTSYFRKANGCQDTRDNSNDWTINSPFPRNLSTPANVCGTNGACCNGNACSIATQGTCSGSYLGDGSTCTPNQCVPVQGSCCVGTVCSITSQAGCTGTWTLGFLCTPDPCSGTCCTTAGCTIVATAADCATAGGWAFTLSATCGAATCPTPVAVVAGDLAYGASVAANNESVAQYRGTTRVGTWNRFNFIQSPRFDNSFGNAHNARGNLIGLNFGSNSTSGAIFNNFATDGSTNGQQIFQLDGLNYGLTASRAAGLSVSPDNSKLAVIATDSGKIVGLNYSNGSTPGTGAGASITGGFESSTSGTNDLTFSTGVTGGTAWLDNSNLIVFVRNTNTSTSFPATSGTATVPLRGAIFTVPVTGTGFGQPVFRVAPPDAVTTDSSRFFALSYEPSQSPYLYALASSFATPTSRVILHVIDVSNWSVVQSVQLTAYDLANPTTGTINTGREIKVANGFLYLSQYAGSDVNAQASAIINRIALTTGGQLADTSGASEQYIFKAAGTALGSFNGFDIALTDFGGVAPSGVCCRGVTCTTGLNAANCIAVNSNGVVINASFKPTATACNSTGSLTQPCCYGNFDRSTDGVQVADIFAFLSAFFSGSPYAVQQSTTGGADPVGTPGVPDIFNFLSSWFGAGGCN